MSEAKTYKNQEERETRNKVFRAIVANLPGETGDDRMREVCSLLHCSLNTVRMWASNTMERVITQKDLGCLFSQLLMKSNRARYSEAVKIVQDHLAAESKKSR